MDLLPTSSSVRLLPSPSLQISVIPSYLPHPFSKEKRFYSSASPSVIFTSVPYSQPQNQHYLHHEEESYIDPRRDDSNNPRKTDDDDPAIGDCLIFEEGAFETENHFRFDQIKRPKRGVSFSAGKSDGDSSRLIPEKWKEIAAEINLTKQERRKFSQQLRAVSRLNTQKRTPLQNYGETKLSQLNHGVLDNPTRLPSKKTVMKELIEHSRGRVDQGIYVENFEGITEFFESDDYVLREKIDDKNPQADRRLFTKEEYTYCNRRIPYLAKATSRKWLPLHALALSGEFYLLDLLLKHNVDINAADKDGLTAIHKAILSKKHAIVNYLLRNSANPFVRDMDGATLMHYAVLTASNKSIKILLLYKVDINLPDYDGWTPLHLAVQTQRIDIVSLLLKNGVDATIKNKDGLRPVDLCLYSGHNVRTLKIIKLLKEAQKAKGRG